jgi:hypothetical protein
MRCASGGGSDRRTEKERWKDKEVGLCAQFKGNFGRFWNGGKWGFGSRGQWLGVARWLSGLDGGLKMVVTWDEVCGGRGGPCLLASVVGHLCDGWVESKGDGEMKVDGGE